MITTYRDRQRRLPENNLEVAGAKPEIKLMMEELQDAAQDMNWYLRRNQHAYDYAYCRWDGQTVDGRKHGDEEAPAFPWESAADARLRTVATIIKEHVMFAKWAYKNARVKAEALRPAVNARGANKASLFLKWMIYTQLRIELQREFPLAWWWTYTYGAAVLHVGWERSRRLELFPLSMPDLAQLVQMNGADAEAMQLLEAIQDPEQEDAVAALVQSFSDILTLSDARKIVVDLRDKGEAQIPVARVYRDKPRVTALRSGVDVWFPGEMDDPQSPNTRWMGVLERLSETELRGRIQTDNYDPAWVEEVLKHKGELMNETWVGRTMVERSGLTEGSRPLATESSFKHLVEIVHRYGYAVHHKTPCLYHTVFCPHAPTAQGKNGQEEIYGWHGPLEYDHGQIPMIAMRRQTQERALLSSQGIAEEAYTDEQALKTQLDGMTDRTSIILQPPLIVPPSRALAIANTPMPRATIGARPNELKWMEQPPWDNTPIELMKWVVTNLDRRYPLFGADVDPDLKKIYREEQANDRGIELELCFGQIFELCQQFKDDNEVQQIVGPLETPFHVSKSEIQGQHSIIVSVDPAMINDDYADKKLKRVMEGMPLNQGGNANVNKLFKWWMEEIDPDLADMVDDDEQATEREKKDELAAVQGMLTGVDQPFPMFGNHELRLKTLQEATFSSQNPDMAKRLMQNPDSVQMLQNRIKFFENQIQQRQVNPQIGRTLARNTFAPRLAPETTSSAGGNL